MRITIPSGDIASAREVKKYNGKVTKIRSINHCRKGYSYTLAGCKSNYGIPYEFVAEWLTPWEDEVTE